MDLQIPDKIYLQIEDDGEPLPPQKWTHCVDRVNDSDVEYVRVPCDEIKTMTLRIPDELQDEFNTFLEVGLASVTALPDEELTENELRLIQLLFSVSE